MDVLLLILAVLLAFTGIVGCIVPGLPGPPLNYISILIAQTVHDAYSTEFMLFWAAAVVIVTVLDYYLPLYVSKKFGSTRQGITGSIAGMIIGIFFSPIGMIAGLIAGAVIGDLIAGKSLSASVRSGMGSALGTFFSIGLKLIVSVLLSWYLIRDVVLHYI